MSRKKSKREFIKTSKVSIVRVRQEEIKKSVYKALEMLEVKPSRDIKKILIKPNLCHYYSPDTGITTDPSVVSAIIDYLREKINSEAEIIIGEADATEMKADVAFKLLRFDQLSKEKEVELLNLSKDELIPVEGKFVKAIPGVMRSSDMIVTVPKLKTHMNFKMSVCLKNQFGAIPYWKKSRFHKNIESTIAEAAKFMKPNLCVVDGIIALEGKGPYKGGQPRKMDLIIAGTDPVATDFVCAKIMGFHKVGYLTLAEREKIGSTKNIQIVGEEVEAVMTKFRLVTPKEKISGIVGKVIKDVISPSLLLVMDLGKRLAKLFA